MKMRIVRIGNSRGIRLPKILLKKARLGNEVQLQAEPGRIMITGTIRPRAGWAEAAQRMRARNEDELQLDLLAGRAKKALTRMIEKLDKAHAAVRSLRRNFASRKR